MVSKSFDGRERTALRTLGISFVGRHRAASVASGLVIVAALIALVAGSSSSSASSTPRFVRRAPFAMPTPPQHASDILRKQFAVFRPRAHTAAGTTTPLPPVVAASYTNHPGLGLDVAAARDVQVNPTFSAWVVPGTSTVCMVYRSDTSLVAPRVYSGVCSPIGPVESTGVMAATDFPTAGGEQVAGLVMNGNSSVRLTRTDGSSVSAAVVRNVFVATETGSERFRSVSVQGPTGSRVSVPLSQGPS